MVDISNSRPVSPVLEERNVSPVIEFIAIYSREGKFLGVAYTHPVAEWTSPLSGVVPKLWSGVLRYPSQMLFVAMLGGTSLLCALLPPPPDDSCGLYLKFVCCFIEQLHELCYNASAVVLLW